MTTPARSVESSVAVNSRPHIIDKFKGTRWRFVCALFLICTALPSVSFAQTFSSLLSFNETAGANPYGALVQGTDGNFYGTTEFGGADGQGTVYRATPDGTLTTLYSFCSRANCTDGSQPFAGLVLGSNGLFYGTTLTTVYSITSAGDLTTLHTFCSQTRCADGSFSYGKLVRGTDGNFYGTTFSGGISSSLCSGCGTIFRITPGGTLTTLYTFHGADGFAPYSGLVQGVDGNFYGMTSEGGANRLGTVFKITPAGTLTLLHGFNGSDGSTPYGSLVQGKDLAFYGTTTGGGVNGDGTVFRITRSGNLTLLHSFDYINGETPFAGVVQGADAGLYGTTYAGGHSTCSAVLQCGTIFRIAPSGQFKTLYRFCSQTGCADGGGPFSGLVQAADGTFYGTTILGGNSSCGADGTCGTLFKFSEH